MHANYAQVALPLHTAFFLRSATLNNQPTNQAKWYTLIKHQESLLRDPAEKRTKFGKQSTRSHDIYKHFKSTLGNPLQKGSSHYRRARKMLTT